MAAFDSTIRLRQANQPEFSGYTVQVIQNYLSGNPPLSSTGVLSGIFYPLVTNPSGFVTSGQTGVFKTQTDLDSLYSQTLYYVAQNYYPNSNPSGFITGVSGNSNTSGVVYTTGDQTISGVKTFVGTGYFLSGLIVSGSGLRVSGAASFSQRPTVNGTGVLLSGFDSYNVSGEIWITLRTDGLSGNGSISSPYDGSTAQKLSGIFKSYESKDVNINFFPGTYYTYPTVSNYGHLWKPGAWNIKGAGMDKTTIILTGVTSGRSYAFANDYSTDTNLSIKPMTVQDLTIDGVGYVANASVAAVMIHNTPALIARVRATNFGNSQSGLECFPLQITPLSSNPQSLRNAIIEDSIVINPWSGTDSFTAFTISPIKNTGVGNSIFNSDFSGNANLSNIIRGCYADLNCHKDNIYSTANDGTGQTIYRQAFSAPMVENNYCQNITIGMYIDTWNFNRVIWRNNTVINARWGLALDLASGYSGDSVLIENNVIELSNFSGYSYYKGMRILPGSPASGMRHVDISNNKIYVRSGTFGTGSYAGIEAYGSIENLTISNNILADFSLVGGTNILASATQKRVYNNLTTGLSFLPEENPLYVSASGDQTISGVKTFKNKLIANDIGAATGGLTFSTANDLVSFNNSSSATVLDFSLDGFVQSLNAASELDITAQNSIILIGEKVGINTYLPTYTLDVNGSGNFKSGLYVNGIPALTSVITGNVLLQNGYLTTPNGGLGKLSNILGNSSKMANNPSYWSAYGYVEGSAALENSTEVAAPDGTFTAIKSLGTGVNSPTIQSGILALSSKTNPALSLGTPYVLSCWLKNTGSSISTVYFGINDPNSTAFSLPTSDWTRYVYKTTALVTSLQRGFQTYTLGSGQTYFVWGPQLEIGSGDPGPYVGTTTIGINSGRGLVYNGDLYSGDQNMNLYWTSTGYVANVSGYLRGLISSSSSGVNSLSVGGTLVSGAVILSGINGVSISTGTSNTIYFSGQSSQIVYTTGAQTISGTKTFLGNLVNGTPGNSVGANSSGHSEGFSTTSLGLAAHAEGYGTISSGNYSHAEGSGTSSSGIGSHAEGAGTKALGNYSHAEGYGTISSGDWSHSEGRDTVSYGIYSHSEGVNTRTTGHYSHAEGDGCITSGHGSHAEGYQTKAFAVISHTEGAYCTGLGEGAHAEGRETLASGIYSHTNGSGTIAWADFQFVLGKNNVPNFTSLAIIGNGTGYNARSNVLTIESGGLNVYGSGNFTGGLFVSGVSVLTGVATGSFVTTGQTGNANTLSGQSGSYYLNYANMTGSIAASILVVYQTGNQTISGNKTFTGVSFFNSGAFSNRPTVNGTGVLLSGEASSATVSNVVYTTGNGTTQTISGSLTVTGHFSANTKSFLIDHPTIPGKKLQYGVTEGPEHSVFIRGKLINDSFIFFPHYWSGLVDLSSITVSLTPIGTFQNLYVNDVNISGVKVTSDALDTNCYYHVFAERKDVPKLEVEV